MFPTQSGFREAEAALKKELWTRQELLKGWGPSSLAELRYKGSDGIWPTVSQTGRQQSPPPCVCMPLLPSKRTKSISSPLDFGLDL